MSIVSRRALLGSGAGLALLFLAEQAPAESWRLDCSPTNCTISPMTSTGGWVLVSIAVTLDDENHVIIYAHSADGAVPDATKALCEKKRQIFMDPPGLARVCVEIPE